MFNQRRRLAIFFARITAFFALCFSASVLSQDINCGGKVTVVMDYPQQCNTLMAFKTEGTNGKWVCPPSANGSSMVLTAIAAGKSLDVYIDSNSGSFTCSDLPQYVLARYLIIRP